MPIDASIPLGVQPVKIESGLNQLAGVGEAMKIGEMQRSIGTQNKLRDLYSQGIDVSTPEGFKQVAAIDPATAIKLRSDALKGKELESNIKKTGLEIDQKQMDLFRERIGNLAFNPSNANIQAHLEDSVKRGEISPQQAQQQFTQATSIPMDKRPAYFTEMGVKTLDRYQASITKRGQDITAETTRRGQDLQANPIVQGNIAEARKIGEARAEGVIAPAKDARANRKALQTAGYDPVTGTDKVSDLIKQSTSGAVETGLAGTYGAMPGGGTTSGQEAIGKLAAISRTLTLDLLDGKLGAGISNDDRVALEQRFGDMANSMVPADKRLAAWTEAKDIMRRAAMFPEPGAAPAAEPSGGKGGKPSLNDIFNNPKK